MSMSGNRNHGSTTLVVMTLAFVMMTSLVSAVPKSTTKSSRGCVEPSAPKRGSFMLSEDKLSIEFFCQTGQHLIGSNEASCQNGLWTSQPPVCVGGDCNLPTIRDGSMVSLHGGGILRIQCRSGFELQGGSNILACIDGRWNSTKPECINSRKENNEEKQSAKNVNLVGKHPKSKHRETEEETAKKQKTHDDWLRDSDYSCVRDDVIVHPPPIPNARSFTHWTILDGLPRLFTTYRCKWGFMPTPGGASDIYCQKGEWIGTPPRCKTVVYEEHGQRDFTGIARSLSHEELLLHADYSCMSARPDGSLDPPVPENASPTLRFVVLEGRPHLYTEYVCNEGFELANNKRAHLYCKSKTWTGEMPRCIRATSSRSCAINNGGCNQLCSYDNRGLAFCSCKQGFLLQPDKVACLDVDECEVNGGDCSHICTNSIGSFECSCFSGYALEPDRKNCTKMQDNSKKAN